MTFDERLEALLNRAGQTIEDLPYSYRLDADKARCVSNVACRWFINEDSPDGVNLLNLVSIPLFQYILHMTDVIDRMETALENLIGERDYLAERLREVDPDLCGVCVYAAQPPDAPECEACSNREPDNFHFAGVPMDWDADAHSADH